MIIVLLSTKTVSVRPPGIVKAALLSSVRKDIFSPSFLSGPTKNTNIGTPGIWKLTLEESSVWTGDVTSVVKLSPNEGAVEDAVTTDLR